MDELYDLSADPYEMRNLSRPEPQQPLKELRAGMQELLLRTGGHAVTGRGA